MPTVTRRRRLDAPPQAVWSLVEDPDHLPRWWPGVSRVEEASRLAWTKVLVTPRGRTVRADWVREAADEPSRIVWRQELLETPFERFLRESLVEIGLEPQNGSTAVSLTAVQKLRGLSRLGGFMMRRATRRLLDDALDGLERALVGEPA